MNPWLTEKTLRLADLITPSEAGSRLWEVKNAVWRRQGATIGSRTALASGFWCMDPRRLVIGREVAIGANVRLHNFGRISIGDLATIAAETCAVNGWHDTRDLHPEGGDMTIGRGVWIGMAARLVGAITLGDHCIVGAGSVVIHDVPEGAIVAGTPARVIGERDLAEKQWHFGGRWWKTETFETID